MAEDIRIYQHMTACLKNTAETMNGSISSPVADSTEWTKVEICPICCEDVDEVFTMETYAGTFHSACNHAACAGCIDKWVTSQLPVCRANKIMRVRCFGCHKTMPQQLVLRVKAADALAGQLDRREALQRNVLFPAELQVECRRAECVGVGYLGFETVMCMICEDQWPTTLDEHALVHHAGAPNLVVLKDGSVVPEYIGADGVALVVKNCPKCGVLIEKNGGCDHMKCQMCKHDFFWSTGKSFRCI